MKKLQLLIVTSNSHLQTINVFALLSTFALVSLAVRVFFLAIRRLLSYRSIVDSKEYAFFSTQLGNYAACLLIANALSSVAGLMGLVSLARGGILQGIYQPCFRMFLGLNFIRWSMHYAGYVFMHPEISVFLIMLVPDLSLAGAYTSIPNRSRHCSLSFVAVMQFANVSSAYYTVAIAIHTFSSLVLRRRQAPAIVSMALLLGWVLAAVICECNAVVSLSSAYQQLAVKRRYHCISQAHPGKCMESQD